MISAVNPRRHLFGAFGVRGVEHVQEIIKAAGSFSGLDRRLFAHVESVHS